MFFFEENVSLFYWEQHDSMRWAMVNPTKIEKK